MILIIKKYQFPQKQSKNTVVAEKKNNEPPRTANFYFLLFSVTNESDRISKLYNMFSKIIIFPRHLRSGHFVV